METFEVPAQCRAYVADSKSIEKYTLGTYREQAEYAV